MKLRKWHLLYSDTASVAGANDHRVHVDAGALYIYTEAVHVAVAGVRIGVINLINDAMSTRRWKRDLQNMRRVRSDGSFYKRRT